MVFDHIGVVTPDLESGARELEALFPLTGWTRAFNDTGLRVSVRFARDASGVVYELIAPLGENSPVAATLRKKDGILNQVAYRTADLEQGARALREARAIPVGKPSPAIAFGGARVQFFLTKAGFIIELIEAPSFEHAFTESL